jgi:hypothetical protein
MSQPREVQPTLCELLIERGTPAPSYPILCINPGSTRLTTDAAVIDGHERQTIEGGAGARRPRFRARGALERTPIWCGALRKLSRGGILTAQPPDLNQTSIPIVILPIVALDMNSSVSVCIAAAFLALLAEIHSAMYVT